MNATPLQTEPSDAVFYVESSLPRGVTIREYRRTRPSAPSRWQRLKRLAGGSAGTLRPA